MRIVFVLILSSLFLVACNQETAPAADLPPQLIQLPWEGSDSINVPNQSPRNDLNEPVAEVDSGSSIGHSQWPDGETQQDSQGFVEVAVKPLNLNSPEDVLDFEVSLNTHSVDLSMDLAALAILTADNGLSVAASSWDAPVGGHHVAGILSFPLHFESASLLENASHLTLTIHDVDAAERTFEWDTIK
jgi:hypothetical protein